MSGASRHSRLMTQEGIVFALAIVLFAGLAIFLDGFGSMPNLLSLVQAVSVVGSLGVAMAIVVIGRGIDLSLVASTGGGAVLSLPLDSRGDVA